MVRFARGLFAVASASLAILSLAYGDFAPGGQNLPAWIPWREICIHGSAILVLAASVGVCFPRTVLMSVVTVGAYQARHLPEKRIPGFGRRVQDWEQIR